MTESITRRLSKSVRFIEPTSHFHTLTDEFIIQVGKYLLAKVVLPIPSFKPHWENYKHAFDTRTDYTDYLSFRSTCHKTSYLLKPIKKDLEIEIKSKEMFLKWCKAPQDVLDNVIRLRMNFTLDPTDDLPRVSTIFWNAFISLLYKLPNLIELYFTSTPFCWHGLNGQTFLFNLPDPDDENSSSFPSILTLSIEVKCRSCSEHFIKLLSCFSNFKNLKCCSQDSVAQEDLEEPYDFLLTIDERNDSYKEKMEILYLKYWDLDTFNDGPVADIHDSMPNLKKLIYTAQRILKPYTLEQRVVVEAFQDPRSNNNEWLFLLRPEDGHDMSIGGSLQEFATQWSIHDKMEEFDPGFMFNLTQYTTQSLYPPGPKRGDLPPNLGTSSTSTSRIKVVHPDEYRRICQEAMKEAMKAMKTHWPSLKQVTWWQDRHRRKDSPTRDYLKWITIIPDDTTTSDPAPQQQGQSQEVSMDNQPDQPIIDVIVQGPEIMNHDLTWSDEGLIPPDVEDPLDNRPNPRFPASLQVESNNMV